jgi:sulfhydrogenase subunit beta (sulfur reductase)
MAQTFLEQARVADFIAHLLSRHTVFAPHRRGRSSFAFEKTADPAAVELDYPRTLGSVKKFFLPPRETLMDFDLKADTATVPPVAPVDAVFLGVHSYDLAAVRRLDHNFLAGNPERNYLTRRQGARFIGVSYVPDKFHFAGSVGIDPYDMTGCDVFLTRHPEGWIVDVLTEEGAALVKGFTLPAHSQPKPKRAHFTQHVYVPQASLDAILDASYDHPIWNETARTCLGCGTCNLVCPTCYCFNVEDNVAITADSGSRERSWDGCMLRSFTEVAGGEVFREKVAARQRHRVYRKFKYLSETTGQPWCVGCGRCTQACTVSISIVEIVNRLIRDAEREEKAMI